MEEPNPVECLSWQLHQEDGASIFLTKRAHSNEFLIRSGAVIIRCPSPHLSVTQYLGKFDEQGVSEPLVVIEVLGMACTYIPIRTSEFTPLSKDPVLKGFCKTKKLTNDLAEFFEEIYC